MAMSAGSWKPLATTSGAVAVLCGATGTDFSYATSSWWLIDAALVDGGVLWELWGFPDMLLLVCMVFNTPPRLPIDGHGGHLQDFTGGVYISMKTN